MTRVTPPSTIRTVATTAAVCLAAIAGACSSTRATAAAGAPPAPASAAAPASATAAAAETAPPAQGAGSGTSEDARIAALARARGDSARRLYTAADVNFMTGMIAHHAQAITMSRWAPTHGASSSVRILADRIINAQQDEIATMQQWLRERGQPVPEPGAGMHMMMHGDGHGMLMPGMLTEAQMKQLDQARGADFDRLFLTDMIQHHRGAVSMVKDLFDSYGAAQDEAAFKLASDVNVDQTTEIARMERMLVMMMLEQRSQK